MKRLNCFNCNVNCKFNRKENTAIYSPFLVLSALQRFEITFRPLMDVCIKKTRNKLPTKQTRGHNSI